MKKTQPKEHWKKVLTPEQYHITREKGTEKPFTGKYVNNHEEGVYYCVNCHQPLFDSETKFDSGSGWPSFTLPIEQTAIEEKNDSSLPWRNRTEVICSACEAHLGHVFPDGPQPTGLRYCINSGALDFSKKPQKKDSNEA